MNLWIYFFSFFFSFFNFFIDFIYFLLFIAVSASLSELSDEEKGELGPIKDVTTRASFWTQQIIIAPIINGYSVLKDYILPVPNVVSMLFYCVGSLIGINQKDMKDLCGDISWDAIKQVIIIIIITIIKITLT